MAQDCRHPRDAAAPDTQPRGAVLGASRGRAQTTGSGKRAASWAADAAGMPALLPAKKQRPLQPSAPMHGQRPAAASALHCELLRFAEEATPTQVTNVVGRGNSRMCQPAERESVRQFPDQCDVTAYPQLQDDIDTALVSCLSSASVLLLCKCAVDPLPIRTVSIRAARLEDVTTTIAACQGYYAVFNTRR